MAPTATNKPLGHAFIYNRWVAAPLSIATPPPGQNATALFGCVIMSH